MMEMMEMMEVMEVMPAVSIGTQVPEDLQSM